MLSLSQITTIAGGRGKASVSISSKAM